MVVSMTGYGRSKTESSLVAVTVEVKTVNHRFIEYSIRMPRELLKLEDKIKKKLGEKIFRGRAEVFVTIEGEGIVSRKLHIDWKLLDQYYQYITKIKEQFGLDGKILIADMISREGVLTLEEQESSNGELESLVLQAADEAAAQLRKMREAEGAALERDVSVHLMKLTERTGRLAGLAPAVVSQYRARLEKRIEEFESGQFDESRLLAEVALFADKADINEELARLKSHIKQFAETLLLEEPIGRKLDFLVQEMNREVNTIGSKANDAAIAKEVVEMKSLLEKMKEQIQNIE
ncbi:YicC/YloC family endoribonuclease [Bacillus sp. V33-4]|uniref:YicC/YloC family endoribonuclease n=1 Tax=Bacillus sp. V33-4 TaxID=2054169 RepID=UPI000C772EB2|nr:YicC/YloC family endoribonuclease [Bacillus sp. V33-4]PLR87526.1 YicC family protein [Bacillus sp. V33-4]